MILNHKAAIELLVDQADEIGFNRYTILNLHALLVDNLLADPQAGGRLRRIPVRVDGTVFHPQEVPQLIDERFEKFSIPQPRLRIRSSRPSSPSCISPTCRVSRM